jgi:hypothetical protein
VDELYLTLVLESSAESTAPTLVEGPGFSPTTFRTRRSDSSSASATNSTSATIFAGA